MIFGSWLLVVGGGVDEGEVGAGVGGFGVGEFGAELGDCSGASGCGEGVDADVEFVADDLEVGGGAECFAEQGACFVVSAGVVGGEEAGDLHLPRVQILSILTWITKPVWDRVILGCVACDVRN